MPGKSESVTLKVPNKEWVGVMDAAAELGVYRQQLEAMSGSGRVAVYRVLDANGSVVRTYLNRADLAEWAKSRTPRGSK